MQCSAVKYDAKPSVIIMTMLKEPIFVSPSIRVQYALSGMGTSSAEFRIPLFLNKFIEAVEMPIDAFHKTWDDITHNRPQSFQKLDIILKNPAPPTVSHMEVLKKTAFFFSNSMNLKVFAPDDPSNFYVVRAVG